MTGPTLTVASLIKMRKAQQYGEALAGPIIVHDLALVGRPERSIRFDPTRVAPTVIVRTTGNTPFFIERIELLQPDADERLGRYTPCSAKRGRGPTRRRRRLPKSRPASARNGFCDALIEPSSPALMAIWRAGHLSALRTMSMPWR
jgi:hypothetical protein